MGGSPDAYRLTFRHVGEFLGGALTIEGNMLGAHKGKVERLQFGADGGRVDDGPARAQTLLAATGRRRARLVLVVLLQIGQQHLALLAQVHIGMTTDETRFLVQLMLVGGDLSRLFGGSSRARRGPVLLDDLAQTRREQHGGT